MLEPEALAETRDAVGIHLEGIAGAERAEALEIGAAFGGVDVLGELTEEVLEAVQAR